PLRGATEGWSVSLGDLLEHLDVQRLVGDDLLQSVVLLFQRLQPLGLLALHAAVLGSPATQGGFGMPQFSVPAVMEGWVRKRVTVIVCRCAAAAKGAQRPERKLHSDARTPTAAGSRANCADARH